MLMLLRRAQVHEFIVGGLDMQADNGLVESAAQFQIGYVERDVARADDVERRLEDVLRYGHCVFPGMTIRFPVSESCACPAPARRAWFPCRNRTSNRRRRGRY